MQHEERPGLGLWHREMKLGEFYHPAFAWGRWVVLICILLIFIFALTGVVPASLEQIAIVFLIGGVILGSVIGIYGGFKSFHRDAYPFMAAMLLIAILLVLVWALLR
ncbi:MAG: hypothetical protein EAX95_05420 [Candidatus Thorarchaeota archaeon]|nr:hypothetical protein [Candidatus Thorarchaeota archaeon]